MYNDLTADSWGVSLSTEDLSITVDTQSITETPRTLKLFSQTTKKYSFLQHSVRTEITEAVNSTLLYNLYV